MQEIVYKAPERVDGNNAAAVQQAMVELVAEKVKEGENDLFVVDMENTK